MVTVRISRTVVVILRKQWMRCVWWKQRLMLAYLCRPYGEPCDVIETALCTRDPLRALLLSPQTPYLTCLMYNYSRPYTCTRSRYTSVSIVTRTTWVRFPVEIFYRHRIQTGCGALTAFRHVCTGGFVPGDEADRSPPSSADVTNGGAIPPLSRTS
jgi:hypothetical protein